MVYAVTEYIIQLIVTFWVGCIVMRNELRLVRLTEMNIELSGQCESLTRGAVEVSGDDDVAERLTLFD